MANDLIKSDARGMKDKVMNRVMEYQKDGKLVLPKNYSPETAIQAAMLALEAVETKDNKLALDVCSQRSIANALFDMVIQGLSVAKKQCYFIPYGRELSLQRSYFGTVTALKNVMKGEVKVPGQVVYEGDELEYEIDNETMEKNITKHTQKFGNVKKDKIIGAYASVIVDGKKVHTELMTIDQIHQSWRQSKMRPFDDNGKLKLSTVHGKFPDQMALRTVTERACKILLNTSDDSEIMVEAFNRTTKEEYERDVTPDTRPEEGKNRLSIDEPEDIDNEPKLKNESPEEQNESLDSGEYPDEFYDEQTAAVEEDPAGFLFG